VGCRAASRGTGEEIFMAGLQSAVSKFVCLTAVAAMGLVTPGVRADEKPFRPPAVPLITSDPYLSIWSAGDHLNDVDTTHWTRRKHPLVSLIRIDDKTYRLMGAEPKDVAAFPQTGLKVLPTRSMYDFDDGHIHVSMTFMSPALPNDLTALSKPLSYITWSVRSVDGAKHAVSIYDSTSSLLAVNEPRQQVNCERSTAGDLTALRAGTVDQTFLAPAGDDTRIDWGYAYVAAPTAETTSAIGGNDTMLQSFVTGGKLPAADDAHLPRAANDDQPVLAFAYDLGSVAEKPIERHLIVAYDEIWSILYFGKQIPPYWRRDGAQPADMLQSAEKDYPDLVKRCAAFDSDLMADMTKVGGAHYAQITALAYRQCLCGCGLAADSNKQPLLFTKENTSNGDIATVDVIFPMDPIFVFISPTLAKASLVSVLDYGASPRWKFPCAPHDLGTYPVARGTDDGGEAMPVEESGNILILMDGIAHAEGNAKFCDRWWPKLTEWAQYLEQFGLDPEEQLCTDDFMGHLAHNANLSVKAIVALAAYGDLCEMRGDKAAAARYKEMAKVDAQHWIKASADGGHSRLAFDKPGTWSQKYNLVWDRILGLNVFPPTVAAEEIAFYKTVMQKYGLPLDSRPAQKRTFLTKTDWSVWVASMTTDQADFDTFIEPIYNFLDQSSLREPLVDSYETDQLGKLHRGSPLFRARPVVGGLFIKMLDDPAVWKKWASADKQQVGDWAPFPKRPEVTEIVPTSKKAAIQWRYTFEKPAETWTSATFDDATWKQGAAAFGKQVAGGVKQRTAWGTDDIWLRREFTMPEGSFSNLEFIAYHDEDIDVYLNGVPALHEGGYNSGYEPFAISPAAKEVLKPGTKITIAVHCHQTIGGQGIDVGIANVSEPK
jgi:hypothetical protein